MTESAPVVRELNEQEIAWLKDGRRLADGLFTRYAIGPADEMSAEAMDATYLAWCSDRRSDLPPLQSFYQGFGFLLGELFRSRFAYEWKVVTDQFGTEISLFMSEPNGTHRDAVLSPLSMVAKRVRGGQPFFADLFRALCRDLEEKGYQKRGKLGRTNESRQPR